MKQTLLLFFLILVPMELTGQLVKGYGVKLALTSANQTFEPLETNRRKGFNVAGYVEWFTMPYFSLLTQMEYVQRGMTVDFIVTSPSGPTPIGTLTQDNRVDYLSIPILVKVGLPTTTIRPFVIAGPRVDFPIGHRTDDNVLGGVYDKFKTMFGASVGVGVETSTLLPVTVAIEARYNIDFSDSYVGQAVAIRNNAFDFWLGVGF
jgi:hypothetical protein